MLQQLTGASSGQVAGQHAGVEFLVGCDLPDFVVRRMPGEDQHGRDQQRGKDENQAGTETT